MTYSEYKAAKPGNDTAAPESEIQFSKIFEKFLFHWPLYLFAILLSVIMAWVYLRYTKPVYISSAKIYIKDENKNGISRPANLLDGFAGGSKLVENEMEIIKSPIIIEDVIKNNRFNIRYFEKGNFSDFEVYEKRPVEINILSDSVEVGNYFFEINRKNSNNIEVTYTGDDNMKHVVATRFGQSFTAGKDRFSFDYFPKKNQHNITGFKIKVDSIAELAYIKADELRTGLINNKASVFVVVYEDGIARRSADFLNAILKKYNEYTLEDKNQTALNSIKFIDGRLQALGSELGGIETEVETFKSTRGITQIDENSRLYLEQAKDADQKLNEAKIQLTVYDQLEDFIKGDKNTLDFAPVIGNVDASLTSLINRYQELLSNKKRLSLSLEPGSTLSQNLEQQIVDARKTIRDYISGYRQNALATRSGLQKKVNEIEGHIANVPKYERQFINLQRQQSVKNSLYLYLLQKKEETAISYASNIVDNKIISPAPIPKTPVKPQKGVTFIIFILGGIVLTSLYLVIKYISNKRINTKKDIQKLLDMPVIAEVFKQQEKKMSFFEDVPRSILKEQMLNLKSNLKFLLNGVHHTPVILFTSSISGEGKTFLSAHLANTLTSNDKKVLLIELDLRKPKLSKSLGMDNLTGLTNYLVGEAMPDAIIKKIKGTNNLYLLPSGPIPPNPIELIENEKMKELFVNLRKKFDYIVVDTAPLGLVADAKSLLPLVDCALYVVRFNYTPKATLAEVVANNENIGFKKIGVIFNGIDQQSSYSYYSYGYSGYGSSYGYSNNETKKNFTGLIRRIMRRMF